jgi:hypothetical protein
MAVKRVVKILYIDLRQTAHPLYWKFVLADWILIPYSRSRFTQTTYCKR